MSTAEENSYTPEQIRHHWEEQALQFGASPSASWSDFRIIELEIGAIAPRIEPENRVLDVGCGNGYSSVRYALQRRADVTGVDYIDEMISVALEQRETLSPEERTRLEFRVGDVRALDFSEESFDCVVSTRVIINLPTWEEQAAGLRECSRVLRSGGLLLLSEATVEGWSRLNLLRREWGLDDIPMPPFNRYVRQEQLVDELASELTLEHVSDFASSYYVATRVLKPLLARVAEIEIDVADPNAEFNRWASLLPPAGDYGTQKLFVWRKR